DLLKSLGEKGLLQIVRIKAYAAHHDVLRGKLREDEIRRGDVADSARPFNALLITTDGPLPCVQDVAKHPAFHSKPSAEQLAEMVVLATDVRIIHLLRLTAKQNPLLRVEEEYVSDKRILREDQVQFLRLAGIVVAWRWKLFADLLGHRVDLLIHPLLGDREEVLKVPMNGGLEILTALYRFQMLKVYKDQRGRGQHHGELQREHDLKAFVAAPKSSSLLVHASLRQCG